MAVELPAAQYRDEDIVSSDTRNDTKLTILSRMKKRSGKSSPIAPSA
jgi:hypothetical protein